MKVAPPPKGKDTFKLTLEAHLTQTAEAGILLFASI